MGLGEGEAEVEGLGLAELLGVAVALFVALGVAVALLVALGVAVALFVALGVAVALLVALGVALLVAFAVAVALALAVAFAVAVAVAAAVAFAVAVAVDLAVAVAVGLDLGPLDDESETASRTRTDRPAGTLRAAEVVAGGWPHTLGAAALAVVTSAVVTVLASAAVLTPRRPMLEATMAAPATMPNAEDPDRADLMAAPSSPWSSSLRPRVSSD
ncbi:MAG: hypothetical protein ACLP5E_18605 [Streptosporangiaceae bacterium]